MFDEHQSGESLRSENKQGEIVFSHYVAPCWNQPAMELRPPPNVLKRNLKQTSVLLLSPLRSAQNVYGFIFIILCTLFTSV